MNSKRSTISMVIAIMALSLVSVTSIQQDVFATTQGISITATADQGSDMITVTGKTVSDITDVTFVVTSPSGNNVVAIDQVSPSDNGDFSATFKIGQTWTEDGFYTITAQQGNSSIYTLTVDVEITNGMTEGTSVTSSTLETGEIISNETNVAKNIGLVLDDIVVNNGSSMFEVTGTSDRVSEPVTLQIIAPNGNLVTVAQVVVGLDKKFSTEITVGAMWKEDGFYTVNAYQNENLKYSDSKQVDIKDGAVVPEFGTIAAMILAVAIISIIAISAKSRLSIIPRY